MSKNEITTTEQQTTAVAYTPIVQVEQSDMMIPFLKVVQSLSEETTPGKDKYNDQVRPGDIYDSVTRTIFKKAKVIICGLKKYYAEWTPEVRGTLVAKHKPNSDVIKNAFREKRKTEKGSEFTLLKTSKDGNELIETYGIVMLVKNDEGLLMPAVITLSKTSFKVGRQLSTLLTIHQSKGLPVFEMSTTSSSNSKGSWFMPTFRFVEYETDPSAVEMVKGIAGIAEGILFKNLAGESGDTSAADDNDLL